MSPSLPTYKVTGWRTIHMFEDYEVSYRGKVRGRYRSVSKPTLATRNGYLRARLLGPCGRYHWRPVHVLVLEAFVGFRPTPRHHGAHGPDRDKNNNRLDNLRWATPEENERDKRAHGTQPKGGARVRTSDATIIAMRELREEGKSYTAIAKRLDMHRTSVQRILKRRAA